MTKYNSTLSAVRLGTLFKRLLREQGVTIPKLAKRLKMRPHRLYRLGRIHDWNTAEMVLISKALDVNLFAFFVNTRDLEARAEQLEADNAALQEQLAAQATEIKRLKDVEEALRLGLMAVGKRPG